MMMDDKDRSGSGRGEIARKLERKQGVGRR